MITVKRFTASWCAPCRMLAPVLKTLEPEYPSIIFEVIDVDLDPEQSAEYNIRTVPTVVILKDTKVLDTIVGVKSKQVYIDKLTSTLHGS